MRRPASPATTSGGSPKKLPYQLVQEQLETFLALVEAKTGAGLPEFIQVEFDAFLKSGIPLLHHLPVYLTMLGLVLLD